MGIPVVQGRDFNDADLQPGAPAVVMVNEAFVREFLNGREPAWRRARRQRGGRREGSQRGAPLNIIGVVKDSRFPSLREATAPTRVPDVPPGEHRVWRT